MTIYDTAEQFRAELISAGLLVPLSAQGVYARSGTFEQVLLGVAGVASAAGADLAAERFWFPPIMPRRAYERTGHLASFPDLAGSISTFAGDSRAHREILRRLEDGQDWAEGFAPSELVLASAACHPLFELMTGTLAPSSRTIELQTQVFRHEPSADPMRMQSFRQHEFVFLGEPDPAREHRDRWIDRGLDVLASLGLKAEAEVATDPFFGRSGQMLKSHQLETELKYELVVSIHAGHPTAVVSANCHLDHFGETFGIHTANGAIAHTACVGFGLERIALALFAEHGMAPGSWPGDLRDRLSEGARRG